MSGDTEREALIEVVRKQAAKGQYLVAGEDHPYAMYARSVTDAILAEFLPTHDDRVRVDQRETDARIVEELGARLDQSNLSYDDAAWLSGLEDATAAIREASDD